MEVEFNQRDLRRFTARLNRESDGREQKRDLVAGLELALEPAVLAAKASILSMDSKGYAHLSLRSAVAANVESQVQLGGRHAGVSVKVHRTRLRGFWHAPMRLNRTAGWFHPGPPRGQRWRPGENDAIYHQVGKPGWFDIPMRLARPGVMRAANAVIYRIVHRLGD